MPPASSTHQTARLAIARNSAGSTPQSALPAVALNVEGATAPAWVELIPAGPAVVGYDGRRWTMPDPAAVIAASDLAKRPIHIDWEHAGLIRADKGLDAPAAAWVEELQARNGAIWGRVSWTPKAEGQVVSKEYRYLSPVFTYDGPTGRITRLAGAGLTNNPNLDVTALNRAGLIPEPLETTLDLAALRTALGLTADASDESILAAAREAKAANRAADLTAFAPRAELTAAVNRANDLQTRLDTITAADRDAKIEAALNKAQTEGKIAPVSRDHYLAMCKAEGGLEKFEALAATLPVLVAGQREQPKKVPEGDGVAGLTAEQLAACKAMGQEPVEYAKSLKGN